MGFIGVYKAIYDYVPQSSGELAISEGDLLFILEKSAVDDWWRAKKRAVGEDEEEPEGLIPNNYVEEASQLGHAKAQYDYGRQTDEELSFSEGAVLAVYDTSDPDWTLAGLDGEYGFVPANYIEQEEKGPQLPTRPRPAPVATQEATSPSPPASPTRNPAAALANIIQHKTGPTAPAAAQAISSPRQVQFTPDASDEDEQGPIKPPRPVSQAATPQSSVNAAPSRTIEPPGIMATPDPRLSSPRGFHMYNIHEMISHMGKNKKMPTTLGINVARGVIMISPEKSKDGPSKEWTAEKLTHYSIEGKHVFVELVRPSKSIDFHAGAKDTAREIVSALGELAGASRAEGLKEVIAAGTGTGQKMGKMRYDFMAQGDDEVTVAEGDELLILDDTQSPDWWMVRRLKNGKQGVVPSDFIDVLGPAPTRSASIPKPSRSMVEQVRADEERLAKEAVRSSSKRDSAGEVSKRTNRAASTSESKSKPDATRVRTWTDRSKSFKVEAEFLGLQDGKIHLHKINGVKIAVPIPKMCAADLEYVENLTGVSLDDDKPLADVKRSSTSRRNQREADKPTSVAGAAVQPPPPPKYDWFDFFLQSGVNPQICERYGAAFERDQLGEESLPDIEPTLLRTLGIKEGDILRVMKYLDTKYSRTRTPATNGEGDGDGGGIFSGPGGALRNNTRKGRPAPAVQSDDTVNPRAFEQNGLKKEQPPDAAPAARIQPQRKVSGFDDDAWDVKPVPPAKPTKAEPPRPRTASDPREPLVSTTQPNAASLGELADLATFQPLKPTPAPQPQPAVQSQPAMQSQTVTQPQSPTLQNGASSAFFDQLAKPGQPPPQPQPRQRPQPSQLLQNQSTLLPPPPQRPMSAPQNQQQSQFMPPQLQQQVTGYQNQPQLAPPGQSMSELTQQRSQQQQQQFNQQQMQPQQTGYSQMMPQQTGFAQYPMNPQPAGFGQFQQAQPTGFQQPMATGYQNLSHLPQYPAPPQGSSPFADPPRAPYQPAQSQQNGYQSPYPQYPQPAQATGVNSFLSQPLQPQRTGPSAFGGQSAFGNGPAPAMPPMPPLPPIPQQQTMAPLQPQKTGPAPPIRFGVTGVKPLSAQPTGRRANLAAATPQNPFGF